MSASASTQVFPTSQQTSAASSNLRSRTICAVRKRHFTRSSAGTFFQVSKYLLAASTACLAMSAVAFWKTPITSDGREGLLELRLLGVITFCPPSHIGYSRPNSAFTFFSASSMRLRFSGFEKSINGSLANSDMCGFCSAVATVGFLLTQQQAIVQPFETLSQAHGRRAFRRANTEGRSFLKVKLDFDCDVRGHRPALLHCGLVFVVLQRLQRRPPQRRRSRQHFHRSDISTRVDDCVDYHTSGLEVPQIIERSGGPLRSNQLRRNVDGILAQGLDGIPCFRR